MNTDRCQLTTKHGVCTLEIYNCKLEDAGKYSCTATNRLGMEETSCVVSVQGNSNTSIIYIVHSLNNEEYDISGRKEGKIEPSVPPGFVPSYRPPRRIYEAAMLADESSGVQKVRSAMELRQDRRRVPSEDRSEPVLPAPTLAPARRAMDDTIVTQREVNEAPSFSSPLSDVIVDPGQTAEFRCEVSPPRYRSSALYIFIL